MWFNKWNGEFDAKKVVNKITGHVPSCQSNEESKETIEGWDEYANESE